MALREILVAFGVDVDSGALKNLSGQVDGLVKKFAGALTVGAIGGFTKAMITSGAAVDDAAARTGVSADEFQRLAYAVELAGGSAEGTEQALILLQKNMKGGLGGKTAIQAFTELAEKIKNTADPALQAQMAFAGFGRQGKQLLPLLRQGAKGVSEMNAEFDALGIGLDKDFIAAAAAADDNLVRLRLQTRGLASQILANVLPALNSFMAGMLSLGGSIRRTLKDIGGFAAIAKAGGFFGMVFGIRRLSGALGMLSTLAKLGKRAGVVGAMFTRFGSLALLAFRSPFRAIWMLMGTTGKLGNVLKNLGGSIKGGVTSAVKGLGAMFSNAAVRAALFYASAALIFLAIDDFVGFLQGKDSLIGRWFAENLGVEETETLRTTLLGAWNQIKQAFIDVKPAIQQVWDTFKQFMKDDGLPALISLFVQLVKVAAAGTIALAAGAGAALKLASGDVAGAKDLIGVAGESIFGKTKTIVDSKGNSRTEDFGGLYGQSEDKARGEMETKIEAAQLLSGRVSGPPTAFQQTLQADQRTTINVLANVNPVETAREIAAEQSRVHDENNKKTIESLKSFHPGNKL